MTLLEHMTTRERFLVYWLLRSYEALTRAGWEKGPTTEETRDRLCDVLSNMELDPNESEEAYDILNSPPSPRYVLPVPDPLLPPEVEQLLDQGLEEGVAMLQLNQAEHDIVKRAFSRKKPVTHGRKRSRRRS